MSIMNNIRYCLFVGAVVFFLISPLRTNADDGSRLWLRQTSSQKAQITLETKSSLTTDIAVNELTQGWQGGPVILKMSKRKGMKADAFTINIHNGSTTVISPSDIGLLYGVYHLLRLQGIGSIVDAVNGERSYSVTETPFHDIRVLDHWDNLDGKNE